MKITIPKNTKIVSSPFLNVDFSFADSLENRLNGFFGLYGDFQKYADTRFMSYIEPYVPYLRGELHGSMRESTDIGSGLIGFSPDYSERQYIGKTKYGKDFKYTTAYNEKAGPEWDKRMMDERGDEFMNELRNFVKEKF